MAFAKNQIYIARRTFVTYESADDIPIQIDERGEYKIGDDKKLIDVATGEASDISNHVAERPEWYFDRKGAFNPSRTVPSQKEYATAVLSAADGFDLDALHAIMEDEGWGPLGRSITKSNLSRILTEICTSEKFGMMKDGEWVVGIGHNKKGCTFHRRNKKVA